MQSLRILHSKRSDSQNYKLVCIIIITVAISQTGTQYEIYTSHYEITDEKSNKICFTRKTNKEEGFTQRHVQYNTERHICICTNYTVVTYISLIYPFVRIIL